MDEAMRQYLSRQISGLQESRQQGDEEFAASLRELDAFLKEHRRIPDWRAKEPSEARLGSWLLSQQAAEHRGVLCSLRRSRLHEVMGPGWDDMR